MHMTSGTSLNQNSSTCGPESMCDLYRTHLHWSRVPCIDSEMNQKTEQHLEASAEFHKTPESVTPAGEEVWALSQDTYHSTIR